MALRDYFSKKKKKKELKCPGDPENLLSEIYMQMTRISAAPFPLSPVPSLLMRDFHTEAIQKAICGQRSMRAGWGPECSRGLEKHQGYLV